MTVTSPPATQATPAPGTVTLTVDGIPVTVPEGTLVIRAAELVGVAIPRFCDHPLLDPVGACRQCLVEVEGQRKPVASCTIPVTEGMAVHTQVSSPVAEKAQRGVVEMLLINHPLDCPVCDKGGECPLQNQALSAGPGESRFAGAKRTFPKPIPLSAQILLDRERCVSCARCTRFAAQVAGDPYIELVERGTSQQVGIYAHQPFNSYFSGNTVQICPVGALTSAAYRFRARPFDLVSHPSACEHCASGCAMRTDVRRGVVLRRLSGNDPDVNTEWNCDKGRFAFRYATQPDRLTHPLVRDEDGTLVPASWPEALSVAAAGLAAAVTAGGVGVLPGGRVTLEDAYAYAKFARLALGTNDVDARARVHSGEEEAFLAALVAGQPLGPTYADVVAAPVVLLVGLEPEEESPILFLRLRAGVRRGVRVVAVSPVASRGLAKLDAQVLLTAPGAEAAALSALAGGQDELAGALRTQGAVVLVGERLAAHPGALSAAAALAGATGARLGWVPRRAGERGAVEAGALPGLLPAGRPVADAAARVDVGTVWGASLPVQPGRDAAGILAAAAAGTLGGLLVGGVDPADLPDPAAALAALDAVGFVVSLEQRPSSVTERADVVLPVAAVAEKDGTFVDWEGRPRTFARALVDSPALGDLRVLHLLAAALGVDLALPDVARARAELTELGAWSGARVPTPTEAATTGPVGDGVLVATWRTLLDAGRLQDGEAALAATAPPVLARVSAATAAAHGLVGASHVCLTGPRGSLTLPVEVTAMADDCVWLPTHSPGCSLGHDLGVGPGSRVALEAAS